MNVFEAAKKRIEYLFDEFDYVYVSFSGGKDSGVMLELAALVSKERCKRFGIFHMDYEAQYNFTTEYVKRTLDRFSGIADIYHICVPFKVTTCTSMYQTFWRPWEKSKKDIWVRDMPDGAMTEDDFQWLKDTMWDYDFQEEFGEYIASKKGKVCCLVGIRTQESLNRWRALYSDKNYKKYKGLQWTNTARECVNAYPIFDWTVEDVWIANCKNGWDYNKLYDIYYQAGVPIHKMRVASPFISEGKTSLRLYQVIEPDTWGKLVSRVNGVNCASIYGNTTAMGWKSITKPSHMTWKEYMYFLLSTLPDSTKKNYLEKLATSIKFWREKGGCLDEDTIKELKDNNIPIEILDDTNYNTDKKPVRVEYLDEYDGKFFRQIPSYKRMCVCIIKNDHLCKYMGFSLTKREEEIRKAIKEKYKDL